MGAPSARIYELSRRWVAKGAKITVITGFPNHPTGVIPPEYSNKLFMRETKEGIGIIRTYVFATPNEGFFKRILGYMSFMFSSIIQGTVKSGKQDIIIATSPQFFVGIAGYVISRIKRIPFIFEIRDIWPESIIQLGILKNKLIIRMLESIEMFLYRQAIHVVGVADSTFEILTKRGIPAEKIGIIKNGVDLQLFDQQVDGKTLKNRLKINEKFLVSYIGTHGLSHALDKVLDTAKILEKNNKIKFVFIGEGAEKKNLVQQARSLNLENVLFLDQILKEELPEYYAASDMVLVTLRNLPLFKCVIPSKIFEIMAMAKPILISVKGESQNLVVEKANAGIPVTPEDSQDLARRIIQVYENKKLAYTLGENGRKFVRRYFDRNKLADKYLELIQDILSKRKKTKM
jgi:glycosyltransferase involved in cell wall biosynthesis